MPYFGCVCFIFIAIFSVKIVLVDAIKKDNVHLVVVAVETKA